ncbi:MAG TPA: helicase-exonuclease AddAB subunit AddA [Epulopiscium sp.]|nr:helicase-exonuclease AddAB subunit AddA [Candidatus Epulonipiscium sp.]
MSTKWTSEQKAAIDVRDRNILVSAAAGSGKTAVLVQRIIERISDAEKPVDIDRLLIVTFTNAAALEMKERIGDGISKKLEEDPGSIHLQRQLHLLQRSSISTIHSFCLKVIRNYFHQIDLDPAFRIGNEAELNLIKGETLEEVLEELFDSGRQDFLELVESYTTPKSTKQLEEMILQMHTFSQSTTWPGRWLNKAVDELAKNYQSIEDTKWAPIIYENITTKLEGAIIAAENALSLCQAPSGPGHYEPTLQNDLDQLRGLSPEPPLGLLSLIQGIATIRFQRLSGKKYECDPDLKEEVKDLRNDGVKKIIDSIKKDFELRSEEELLQDIHHTSRVMKMLVEVVQLFSNKYQEAKALKSIVDYNDLEHYCLDILLDKESTDENIIPSIVAKELQEFYDEIYIDEYQDSNIVQETMLKVISRDDINRFMVGDIKQSIYRFRLANPLLFINKHDQYEKYHNQENLGNRIYIDLVKNFRSRGNILDGINFIFDQVMSRKVGEVEYDENAALYTGATYPEPMDQEIEVGGPIELHIVSNSEEEQSEEKDELLDELNKREAETMLVADMVKKMLEGEKSPTHVYDRKAEGYRKIQPKDIVILLRTTLNVAQNYVQALSNLGIGAFADVATGYFETIEIQTVLALLSIIDNPIQDIPLLTVLRSPIVGLSLDELAIIRKSQKYGSYYEALESHMVQTEVLENDSDMLLQKLNVFIGNLEKYRIWAIDFPMDELISKLFIDTGYYQYVGMLATGLQKQANLRILKKHAAEFEGSSFTGLFNFMNYIDRVQKTSGDFAEAKTVGESENLVRIMSIHKSKGLEFPVVFLCTTDKLFNNQDLRNPVLLHQEYGLGAKHIDVEDRVIYNTFPRIAISQQIKAENISEEMRVLYVALTRAKEKLIITGSVDNFKKTAKNWGQNLKRKTKPVGTYAAMNVSSYLDWIGMAFMSHPDAGEVRQMIQGGEQGYIIESEQSKWTFNVWDKAQIPMPKEAEKDELQIRKDELFNWDTDIVYSDYKEEIETRLNWAYKFKEATKLPVKMTVSEIKQRWTSHDEESEVVSFAKEQPANRPTFMEVEQKLSPTQRGTIIHNVLQHLDLENCKEIASISEQIKKMIVKGKVESTALEIIDLNRLVAFANSPIVDRMKNSEEVYKEQQFVFLMDAKELVPSFKEASYEEEIMVQGVIDCFFEEADGYILVDYKTDYVPTGSKREAAIEHIKENYRKQVEIYSRAIEDITKKQVRESYLYLYSANEWVSMI